MYILYNYQQKYFSFSNFRGKKESLKQNLTYLGTPVAAIFNILSFDVSKKCQNLTFTLQTNIILINTGSDCHIFLPSNSIYYYYQD